MIEMKFIMRLFLTTLSHRDKRTIAELASDADKREHSINKDTVSKVDQVKARNKWLRK